MKLQDPLVKVLNHVCSLVWKETVTVQGWDLILLGHAEADTEYSRLQ